MSQSHDDELERELADGSGIAPLERFVAPAELSGQHGRFRERQQICCIAADNDKDAVLAWLADSAASDAGYSSLRSAAEKLMNWACYQKRQAMSSLVAHDLLEFIAFLGDPCPAESWIGQRATRRKSREWKPFNGPLKAGSKRTVMQAVESLFAWLRLKCYANISLPLDPWSGVDRRSTIATGIRRPNSAPLSFESWGWVERHLAVQPPLLATRLALELLYFAGMKLVDVRTLKESNCLPPSRRFPAWRLFLPGRPESSPWVYAFPPLAASLCEWFGPRKPAPESTVDVVCGGTHWEGEPLLPNCATHMGRVQTILRQAGLMAEAAGDAAAARELRRATPFNLRHAMEIHGEDDQAFCKGVVAHSRFKTSWVFAYMDRIPTTRLQILHWWHRLSHLWANYPVTSRTVSQSEGFTTVSKPLWPRRDLASLISLGAAHVTMVREAAKPIGGIVGAYRAMDRFIRAHVAPRSTGTITDWINRADPKRIASHVRDDVRCQAAWAYTLWAFTVEPQIARRRWRIDWPGYARPSWGITRSSLAVVQPGSPDQYDVAIEQKTVARLVAVWHHAGIAAGAAALSGYVCWGPGTIDPTVERVPLDIAQGALVPAKTRPKQQRVADYKQQAMQRRQMLLPVPRSLCLVYESTGGWSVKVASDVGTTTGDVKQVNLLGVAGRPRVVIYRGLHTFVARLVAIPIEVRGHSPRDCFDKLRGACRAYTNTYGTAWQAGRCKTETLEPTIQVREELFRYGVRAFANRGQFWRAGPSVARAWSVFEKDREERAATPDHVDASSLRRFGIE